MFEGAKAYAAGIFLVVVLAVLGYLGYTYHSTQAENKALTTQVTVEKIENKDLKATTEVVQKSAAITDSVSNEHASQTKEVDHKFDDIQARADSQIQAIHHQAAVRPAPADPTGTVHAESAAETPAVVVPPPTPEENQVAQVRITELWESYCVAAPDAAECKKEQQ